jgi:hypothetical protein
MGLDVEHRDRYACSCDGQGSCCCRWHITERVSSLLPCPQVQSMLLAPAAVACRAETPPEQQGAAGDRDSVARQGLGTAHITPAAAKYGVEDARSKHTHSPSLNAAFLSFSSTIFAVLVEQRCTGHGLNGGWSKKERGAIHLRHRPRDPVGGGDKT